MNELVKKVIEFQNEYSEILFEDIIKDLDDTIKYQCLKSVPDYQEDVYQEIKEKFKKVIYDIKIGGRSEVVNINNRLILIDTQLDKPLECLKELKEKGLINQIKVVVGSVGYGYKHWDEKFKSEEYINSREKYRKYAMGLLKDVDYVYLTECDNGVEDVNQICINLKSYLEESVKSEIILDRVEAIKEAIKSSSEGDAIFIAGRGNKRTLCDGINSMKFFKDSEVVEEILEELKEKGWC